MRTQTPKNADSWNGQLSAFSDVFCSGKFHSRGVRGGSAPKGEAWPQNTVHQQRPSAQKSKFQCHKSCPKTAH